MCIGQPCVVAQPIYVCIGQPCVVSQPHCGGIMGVRMEVV